jgi:tRNA(Arg) A34 adenosine deaminase TadA
MRRANTALAELYSPCPFAPFGTVVVNHTDTSSSPLGELVCLSVNQNEQTGNPTLHGEIAAINNCSDVLAARGLSPTEVTEAWTGLSLYTNGEPCPMVWYLISERNRREFD